MKPRLSPGSLTFPILTILYLFLYSFSFSQDTVYHTIAFQNREISECPKLEYEFVFCRNAVSCKEIWSQTMLQECEARLKEYRAGCKSHVCKAKSLSAEEKKDLLEQQRLIREKGYKLWLEQYKLELIRVDLGSLAKGLRTPPMW